MKTCHEYFELLLKSGLHVDRAGRAAHSSQEELKKRSLEDVSVESPAGAGAGPGAPHYLMLTKQNSFEHDESSLGILTPDQMTDFTVALDPSPSPSCDNISAALHDSGQLLLFLLSRFSPRCSLALAVRVAFRKIN